MEGHRPVADDGQAAAGRRANENELRDALGVGEGEARLVNLTHGGWLAAASDGAYADGLAGVMRVGPFGAAPGASKLVSVQFLEPVPREDVMVLPLRWEATGVTGRLFPVLDADLTITPAGAGQTLITLNGAYRPPLGGIGAGLDRAVLRRVAAATIRALLTRIADALASPAPAAGPVTGPQPRLPTDPALTRIAMPRAPAASCPGARRSGTIKMRCPRT